ncbi:MAG: hypothetical protein HY054_14530 [Proteobacteria bacterium]|nr:hypothetical protein [Pseudomonadota bacterium]
MDPTILAYVVQAVGGAVSGNIFGALTRGGGGLVGRSLIGAIGGLVAGYGADHVAAVGNIADLWKPEMWSGFAGANSAHVSNLITGAAGGGVLGLIGGLLIRPRN